MGRRRARRLARRPERRGWAALEAHGIRTVIDLRNDDERPASRAPRRPGITRLHLPLDEIEARDFWETWGTGWQFGTPLYYGPHLEHFPTAAPPSSPPSRPPRPEASSSTAAGTRPDGHGRDAPAQPRGRGAVRDRRRLVLSETRLGPRFAGRGEEDQAPAIAAFLAERGTTLRGTVTSTLAGLDVERTLRRGGLGERELTAVRARLLERGV